MSAAARSSVCMLAAAEGENNIIPAIEQGDSDIRMEVFVSRPESSPDRILGHLSSTESLKDAFPDIPDEYLAAAAKGASPEYHDENQLKQKLLVAKTFARMAPLILLMRGENIIANNFEYYSPSTGTLDKDGFLGLLRTTDRAFPTLKSFTDGFTAYKDGLVSYKYSYRATFDGMLILSDDTIEPTKAQAISDVELCTVGFDEAGLLKSFTAGVTIAKANEYKDPEVVERIEALTTKIAGNKIKIKSLAGQEHTIAYQKSMEEVARMEYDLGFLKEQVDVEPNVNGLGGLQGLFHAIGLEWPDVSSLIGSVPHKFIGGTRPSGITVPSGEACNIGKIVYTRD